jgi:hypothetical protein
MSKGVSFLCLARVAPYCARGSVRVVSRAPKPRVDGSFANRFRAQDVMRPFEQENIKRHGRRVTTCRSSAAQINRSMP